MFNFLAVSTPGILLWLAVEELSKLCCYVLSFALVACKAKDAAGGLHTQDHFREVDEELKEAVIALAEQHSAIPKAKCDKQEHT